MLRSDRRFRATGSAGSCQQRPAEWRASRRCRHFPLRRSASRSLSPVLRMKEGRAHGEPRARARRARRRSPMPSFTAAWNASSPARRAGSARTRSTARTPGGTPVTPRLHRAAGRRSRGRLRSGEARACLIATVRRWCSCCSRSRTSCTSHAATATSCRIVVHSVSVSDRSGSRMTSLSWKAMPGRSTPRGPSALRPATGSGIALHDRLRRGALQATLWAHAGARLARAAGELRAYYADYTEPPTESSRDGARRVP